MNDLVLTPIPGIGEAFLIAGAVIIGLAVIALVFKSIVF